MLWKHGVTVAGWKDAEFVLSVPGIRENYPFLEVGDLVHLREATPPDEARPGGRWALEARVVALRKQAGHVCESACLDNCRRRYSNLYSPRSP